MEIRHNLTQLFRESSSGIIAAIFACGIDLGAFFLGHTWTYFHYETVVFVIAFVILRFNLVLLSFFALSVVYRTLVFVFGLPPEFIFTIPFSLLACSLLGMVIFYSIRRFQQAPKLLMLTFLLPFVFCLDKKVEDTLFSSYTYYGFQVNQREPTPSLNPVYPKLMAAAENNEGVMLVVWESLGVPREKKFLAPLKNIKGIKVSSWKQQKSSTLGAEYRYLCGLNSNIGNGDSCAPHSFDNANAYHGNALSFFDRHRLYPQMGFKSSKGRASLHSLDTCYYSFKAICDDALLDAAFSEYLKNDCQGLQYVLTLDSHFPYLKYENHTRDLYVDVQKWVLRFKEANSANSACRFIVVSDHQPPATNAFERNEHLVVEIL